MKKLNIAILIVLLMFQTILSPISVFADGVDAGGGAALPNAEEAQSGIGDSEEPDASESQGSLSVGIQTLTSSPDTAGVTFSISNMEVLLGETAATGTPIGGNPITWSDTNKFHISIDWKVDKTKALTDGYEIEFQLPTQLVGTGVFTDKLKSGNDEYGTFTVDNNNKVTFKFNGDAAFAAITDDLIGKFTLQRDIDSSQFEANVGQDLEISYKGNVQGSVPVTFLPSNTGSSKSGKAYRGTSIDHRNADKILWTVDINKAGGSLSNAILKDTPQLGLVIVPESVKVAELILELDGTVKSVVEPGITLDPSKVSPNGTGFDINLGPILTAVRVTYETTIDRDIITDTKPSVGNKVQLFDNSEAKTDEIHATSVLLQYAEPLKKEYLKDYNSTTQELTWNIYYNLDQSNRDGKLNDELTSKNHHYVLGSANYYEVTVNPDLTYSKTGTGTAITPTKNDNYQLDFQLPTGTQAYMLEYKTKLDNRIIGTSDVKVSNTVEGAGTSDNASIDVSQNVFHKSGSSTIDYNNKFLTWTLSVNNDAKSMNNVVVKDTFQDVGLTLYGDGFTNLPPGVQVLFEINGIDTPITPGDKNVSTTKGFKIIFPSNITTAQTITYKTKFDTDKIPADKKYNNLGEITWNEPSLPGSPGNTFTRPGEIEVDDYSQKMVINRLNMIVQQSNSLGQLM